MDSEGCGDLLKLSFKGRKGNEGGRREHLLLAYQALWWFLCKHISFQ